MPINQEFLSFKFNGPDGTRLDKAVLEFIEKSPAEKQWTRSQIKHWIEAGKIIVNGYAETKAGFLLKKGAVLSFSIPQESSQLTPYEMPLDIIFEDASLIVINKAAGISMHPGAGNPDCTIANAIVAHLATQGIPVIEGQRPGIVHRLDKDTTGLIVVAKTVQVHSALAAQFASREAGRCYIALVLSTPRAKRQLDVSESGTIEGAIGRHSSKRQLFSVVLSGGKSAITHWRALERMNYASLVEVRISTGRTHQIRVHMAHVGSPVIGDRVYGDFSPLPPGLKKAANSFGRQALHAATLEFTHPMTTERMLFNTDIPADFKDLIEKFRKSA